MLTEFTEEFLEVIPRKLFISREVTHLFMVATMPLARQTSDGVKL